MSSCFGPQAPSSNFPLPLSLVASLLSISISISNPIPIHAQSPLSSSSTGITSTPIESSSSPFPVLFIILIMLIFVIAASGCLYVRYYRRNVFQQKYGAHNPAPISKNNNSPNKKRHLTGDAPISVSVISGIERTVSQEQQIAAEVEGARAALRQMKAATPRSEQQQRSRKLSQPDKTPSTDLHKADTRIMMDQLYGEGSSHAISHGPDQHSHTDVHRTRVRMSISTPAAGEIPPVSHVGDHVRVDVTPAAVPEVVRERTGPTPRHFI